MNHNATLGHGLKLAAAAIFLLIAFGLVVAQTTANQQAAPLPAPSAATAASGATTQRDDYDRRMLGATESIAEDTERLFYATAAAALLTSIVIAFTVFQLRQTAKGLAAAARSANAAVDAVEVARQSLQLERAYVFLDQSTRHWDEAGSTFSFTFKNQGRTPAILLQWGLRVEWGRGHFVVKDANPAMHERLNHYALAAGASMPVPVECKVEPPRGISEDADCAVRVVITYKDVFGIEHETSRALRWVVEDGRSGFAGLGQDQLNYQT